MPILDIGTHIWTNSKPQMIGIQYKTLAQPCRSEYGYVIEYLVHRVYFNMSNTNLVPRA